ncbi:MAG: NADPH-dependent glutamate synthase [Victivallales bacterium]|nr:NADPH-dependent glutamate synthase [Victivallales bacterium]
MKTIEELDSQAKGLLENFRKLEKVLPKDRMAIPPQEMPSQEPEARRRNTGEVALGYTEAQAVIEANRCLQCPGQPCRESCPVKLPIRDFVHAISQGDFKGAIQLIKEQSLLPAVCGRVCPQEKQCQSNCTMGKMFKDSSKAVAIGRLERYVADRERASGTVELPKIAPSTGKRVAVVGSGPSSLTVAADTRREGHDVTVFEAFHKFGGVMQYGIPEFRLPKAIVNAEVNNLRTLGVHLEPNFLVGRTKTLADLVKEYDAVFLGIGAGLPKFMDMPGENLPGVFSANEFLTRANLMKAYDREHAVTPLPEVKRVAVCGGGNVAMDAARTALRIGAEEVYLVYRRSRAEMPARAEEVEHAEEEGVKFHLLCNPKQILADEQGKVRALECLRYELGEPDASGRRRPVAVPGSEFELAVDTVIIAIGNVANPLIRMTSEELGLEFNQKGLIVCDEEGRTSLPTVFAGGDILSGAATVILAMGQGRVAAAAINKMLAAK